MTKLLGFVLCFALFFVGFGAVEEAITDCSLKTCGECKAATTKCELCTLKLPGLAETVLCAKKDQCPATEGTPPFALPAMLTNLLDKDVNGVPKPITAVKLAECTTETLVVLPWSATLDADCAACRAGEHKKPWCVLERGVVGTVNSKGVGGFCNYVPNGSILQCNIIAKTGTDVVTAGLLAANDDTATCADKPSSVGKDGCGALPCAKCFPDQSCDLWSGSFGAGNKVGVCEATGNALADNKLGYLKYAFPKVATEFVDITLAKQDATTPEAITAACLDAKMAPSSAVEYETCAKCTIEAAGQKWCKVDGAEAGVYGGGCADEVACKAITSATTVSMIAPGEACPNPEYSEIANACAKISNCTECATTAACEACSVLVGGKASGLGFCNLVNECKNNKEFGTYNYIYQLVQGKAPAMTILATTACPAKFFPAAVANKKSCTDCINNNMAYCFFDNKKDAATGGGAVCLPLVDAARCPDFAPTGFAASALAGTPAKADCAKFKPYLASGAFHASLSVSITAVLLAVATQF